MANETVINAEGLGKKYVIGHQAERTDTLRDAIARAGRNLVRSGRDLMTGALMVEGDSLEDFWALRDVSFQVARGEVVGVIGRNGAGKSTLLKILSRITEPSEGRVTIGGRVASLLEVGTGFHPELTGRENIFLNGAILGMSRAEIRRKFDEIVDFAEIDRFLDTPVKRYSSGMYVRLAFAVAAHLEPEILVVDEVLAVGDAEFQKKCLGKMQDVAGHGRTVLFVSHQLGMVARLCDRGIVMKGGRVDFIGQANQALEHYVAMAKPNEGSANERLKLTAHLPAAVISAQAITSAGAPTAEVYWNEPLRLRIQLAFSGKVGSILLGVALDNRLGTRVTTWVKPVSQLASKTAALTTVELETPGGLFAPGQYSLTLALFEPGLAVHHQLEGEWPFVIVDSGSDMAAFANLDYGVVMPPARWRTVDSQAVASAGVTP